MPRLPTSIASCKDRLICYIFLKDEQKLCGLGGGIFGCEMSPRLGWDEKETSSPVKIQAHWDGVAGCRFYEGCLWAIPPWTWSTFTGKNYGCRGLKSDRILGNFLIDNMFLTSLCTRYAKWWYDEWLGKVRALFTETFGWKPWSIKDETDFVNEIAAINRHCQT